MSYNKEQEIEACASILLSPSENGGFKKIILMTLEHAIKIQGVLSAFPGSYIQE
jgi:hypothetical protein